MVPLSSSIASWTPFSTWLGFSPRRISTMPSTWSGSVPTAKMPERGAGPTCTRPTSRTNTGTPPLADTTTFSMSAID